jgi:hypothetical protein
VAALYALEKSSGFTLLTREAHMMYVVQVEYSSKMHGWGKLDNEIREWIGRKNCDGAGTNLYTGWRDLAFYYKDEAVAKKALLAIKKRLARRKRLARGIHVKLYKM